MLNLEQKSRFVNDFRQRLGRSDHASRASRGRTPIADIKE